MENANDHMPSNSNQALSYTQTGFISITSERSNNDPGALSRTHSMHAYVYQPGQIDVRYRYRYYVFTSLWKELCVYFFERILIDNTGRTLLNHEATTL